MIHGAAVTAGVALHVNLHQATTLGGCALSKTPTGAAVSALYRNTAIHSTPRKDRAAAPLPTESLPVRG